LSSLCLLGVASPAFPVMKCTPPAMIPSRSGFTFGHMGGIISVSPLAAALMPAMDLYLRKVVHLGRRQLPRAPQGRWPRGRGRPDRDSARCANSRRVCEVHPERSPLDRTKLLQTKRKGSQQALSAHRSSLPVASDCLANWTHFHSTLGETVLQAARRDPETKTFYSRRRSTR
jgi:hypothetical protein